MTDKPLKTIQQILAPPPAHMVGDGFRVHNFFPGGYQMEQHRMSPFFLMDYNAKIEFPPTDTPRGVGVHPHRGFETVTIAYHGKVAHHDSAGNSGVIGEGEVQWMTAGSGILHKEYHEKSYSLQGGPFQMVQLWVNLPAKDKMHTPKYQAITRDMMGKVTLPDGKSSVEVISGTFQDAKGPASTFTPIQVYNLRMQKGAQLSFNLPADFNTGILIIEGKFLIHEQEAVADHFVLFRNDGETIHITAMEDSIALVLSGEPIREPIVAYGPFLMNTREEIIQAFDDVNTGKFGHLED